MEIFHLPNFECIFIGDNFKFESTIPENINIKILEI